MTIRDRDAEHHPDSETADKAGEVNPRDTDHPTGAQQAAENAADDLPC